MTDPARLLDDIRIASPCTASWDEMTGSHAVRFCGQCKLNVYNLSAMTAAEAAALVERAEGRVCVRLYRRADGTVITRDCPVGLRAAMRRAGRAAAAALAAALGLFSGAASRVVWAATPQERPEALMGGVKPEPREVKMGKMAIVRRADVTVSIADDRRALVDGADVSMTNLGTGDVVAAEADGEPGRYVFRGLEPGVYTLTVSAPGFELSLPRTVRFKRGQQPVRLAVTLHETHAPSK